MWGGFVCGTGLFSENIWGSGIGLGNGAGIDCNRNVQLKLSTVKLQGKVKIIFNGDSAEEVRPKVFPSVNLQLKCLAVKSIHIP